MHSIQHTRRRTSRLSIAAIIALMFFAVPVSADPMPFWSDEELAQFADVIVLGRVVDTRSDLDPAVSALYTSVSFDVTRTIKGDLTGRRLTIKQLGGTSDGVTLSVNAQSTFAVGEDVLVFLERRPRDGSLYTVGLWEGKWRVEADRASGALLAIRDRVDGATWGALGGARDVRFLDRFLERLRRPGARASRWLTQVAASASGPAAGAARLPMARRDAAAASTSRFRFESGVTNGLRSWVASVAQAASAWNAVQSRIHIVDDGASSTACAMSLSRSRAVTVGSAAACGELAPYGSVFAVTGRYLDGSAEAGAGLLGGAFILGNEPNLNSLPSACVEEIAVHVVGHTIGLRDHGVTGDAMAPVLSASCGRPAPILREFESRSISHADVAQLESLRGALGPASSAARSLAATASGRSVFLTWKPPIADAASYLVEAGSAPGLVDIARVSTGTAATALKTTDVAAGTYVIRVRALEEAGTGAASNEATVTVGTRSDITLGAPQALTASVSGSTAMLAWQAPLGGASPLSYLIDVGSSPGSSDLARIVSWDTSGEFGLTGLRAGSYYVRVRAADVTGAGPASNETTFASTPAASVLSAGNPASTTLGPSGVFARGEAVQAQVTPRAADLSSARLVQPENLVYLGAFRVPAGPFANPNSTFDYGGSALAFNPANNSLFLVGHDVFQEVAEITVPEIKASTNTNSLATARMLQPFADIAEGRLRTVNPGDPNAIKLGGLLPYRDKLYATAYAYYDGAGAQSVSHFASGQNLSVRGDLTGPHRVNAPRAGYVSGYLGLVPQAWQAALGGPVMNGQCCLNIISRTSYGPALFTIDPADIGVKNPVPATALVYYPAEHPLGAYRGTSKYFNGATMVKGVVFPEGTRSVLFFGRHGEEFCYGPGTADRSKAGKPATDVGNTADVWCYDPTSADKGGHAYPYNYYVWAYDALELADVKAGKKQPWDVKPYAVWALDLPPSPWGRVFLEGAAYDPATGRIFLTQAFGEGARPVIHVFTIDGTPAAPAEPARGGHNLDFPPRTDSLDFRTQLEAKYRDDLRRQPSPTYVDAEGSVVWTQEYLRYRVNLCSHEEAVARVMRQVDGAPGPPVCGTPPPLEIQFPPRDQSVAFRNELDVKYRDGLRRSLQGSYVDKEGDVVWTQEYLRYRVTGCRHSDAVTRVFREVEGGAPPATCR